MTAATSLLFGQEIRQRRRAKDIIQADLAQRIGCVASAVHEVERRCRPVTEFARAIDFVEALECGRDAESLLIKAAQERGSVDIELAGLEPLTVAIVVSLARRVRQGLDPAKAQKIKRLLAS